MSQSLRLRQSRWRLRRLQQTELAPHREELGLLIAALRDHPASAAARELVRRDVFTINGPSTHLHELRLAGRIAAQRRAGLDEEIVLRSVAEVALLAETWPGRFDDRQHIERSLALNFLSARPVMARRLSGAHRSREGCGRKRQPPVNSPETRLTVTATDILGRRLHSALWGYGVGVARKLLRDRARRDELKSAAAHAFGFVDMKQCAWCGHTPTDTPAPPTSP